jgi:hypothetical protein
VDVLAFVSSRGFKGLSKAPLFSDFLKASFEFEFRFESEPEPGLEFGFKFRVSTSTGPPIQCGTNVLNVYLTTSLLCFTILFVVKHNISFLEGVAGSI